ncbi:MAG: hypothetical protein U1F68_14185 [Gammaproteobacteria bacterium]
MATESFSADEKRLIARILHHQPMRGQALFDYGVYILPSALFAAYGLVKRDFVAVLVAYAALLIMALLYLGYVRSGSRVLHSALRKYEAQVGALRPTD